MKKPAPVNGHASLCHCGRLLGHTGRHKGGPRAADPGSRILNLARREITRHHADIARLKAEIRTRQDALQTVESQLTPLVAFVGALENIPALPAPEASPPEASPPEASITAAAVARERLTLKHVEDLAPEASPPLPAPAEPEPPTTIDPHRPTVATRCSKCRRFRPPAEFTSGSMQCVSCRRGDVNRKAPAEPAEPADPGPAVEATYDIVARWAAERGVSFLCWDDLPRVNRKREDLGLATFKRRMGKAPPGRLAAAMAPS